MAKLIEDAHSTRPAGGEPVDPFFGVELWLQTTCLGQTLWAFGPRHVDFLEKYVSAELREAKGVPGKGPRNGSVASRLPAWMIDGKHRTDVLKGLVRLRSMMTAG